MSSEKFVCATISIVARAQPFNWRGGRCYITTTFNLQGKIQKKIKVSDAKKKAEPFLQNFFLKKIEGLENLSISIFLKGEDGWENFSGNREKKKLYIESCCYFRK